MTGAVIKITDLLSQDCIRVPLTSSDKTSAITELVDVLHTAGEITDRDEVLQAVLARERTRSTGIGHGLAVPHGKVQGCDSLVMAVGKPAVPLDFESADGQPCNLVVLLASPIDRTGPHIQALAQISRLWMNDNLRAAISQANSAEEVYAAIKQYEG